MIAKSNMQFDSQLQTIATETYRHGRQVDRLTVPLTFGGVGRNGGRFGLRIRVPAGFETDYASTPRFLWWLVPPRGLYSRAAVVHDFLCETRPCSRFMADAIFREAMCSVGVPRWRRVIMYYAVRAYSICRGLR